MCRPIDLPEDVTATLSLLTVISTYGTAYETIQSWDRNATWNKFGGDGVQPNDIGAATIHSFKIHWPQLGSAVSIDVTDDILLWLSGERNQSWCALS